MVELFMRWRGAEARGGDSSVRFDMPSGVPPWSEAQRDLWLRIEAHDFEPPTSLNFTQRLARDHAWSLAEARKAIREYRRFCLLAMISPTPVTPSEIVDEVWHQHLIYSRDYWTLWCGKALGGALHHDPTPGGPEAQELYRRQYSETLALYERFFGPPDVGIWPATHVRFARPSYFVVDRARWWLLPRPSSWMRMVLGRRR